MSVDRMTASEDFFAKTLQGDGHVIDGVERHAVIYYILWTHEGEMLGRIYSNMATLKAFSEKADLTLEIDDGRQIRIGVGEPHLDAFAESDLTFPEGLSSLLQ